VVGLRGATAVRRRAVSIGTDGVKLLCVAGGELIEFGEVFTGDDHAPGATREGVVLVSVADCSRAG
jgi:hypothetical protein